MFYPRLFVCLFICNRPRNRSSRRERSIHGKFCSTRSTDSTLGHSVDSPRLGSTLIDLIDLIDFVDSSSSYPFKSRYWVADVLALCRFSCIDWKVCINHLLRHIGSTGSAHHKSGSGVGTTDWGIVRTTSTSVSLTAIAVSQWRQRLYTSCIREMGDTLKIKFKCSVWLD